MLADRIIILEHFRLMSLTLALSFSLQVFVNARLHVSGGALGGGRMVEDESSVAGRFKFNLF